MSASPEASTRIRVSSSVYARAFGSELVLLHFGRGEYFALDEIGAVVWRELEKGEALGTIADVLVSSFAVTREDALRDVVALVGELSRESLVEPVPAPASDAC
jgi:hypothetical protein